MTIGNWVLCLLIPTLFKDKFYPIITIDSDQSFCSFTAACKSLFSVFFYFFIFTATSLLYSLHNRLKLVRKHSILNSIIRNTNLSYTREQMRSLLSCIAVISYITSFSLLNIYNYNLLSSSPAWCVAPIDESFRFLHQRKQSRANIKKKVKKRQLLLHEMKSGKDRHSKGYSYSIPTLPYSPDKSLSHRKVEIETKKDCPEHTCRFLLLTFVRRNQVHFSLTRPTPVAITGLPLTWN